MPGRMFWGEISSCSDCTDYQSRRLHITDADNRSHQNAKTILFFSIITSLLDGVAVVNIKEESLDIFRGDFSSFVGNPEFHSKPF